MNVTGFFNNLKGNFLNAVRKDTSLVIYSIIGAIVGWFIISMTVYPTTPKTITNVPLEIDISGTSAQRNNLSVVSQDIEEVTVQISGERSQIGNMKPQDLTAKAIIDNVSMSGEYDLEIEVESNKNVKFEVTSISPKKVKVNFDEMITQEIEVTPKAPNITIADGFYKDDLVCTPSTITVSGPRMQIEKITSCVVSTDLSTELSSSYSTQTNNIVFYNNGTEFDTEGLNIPTTDFQIDIPVYMKKDIPLDYTIKNAPSYFDTSSLKFKLSSDSITLASPNDDVSKLETLHIGYIDLREIDINSVFTFNIALKAGYKNLSGITSVTASLESEGLDKKDVTGVNDFSFINVPAGYNISPITNNISVTLIGPAEDIAKITAMDIVVQADFSNIDIQSESFSVPITILVPQYKNVWAYMPSDQYTTEVFVEASKKIAEETTSLNSPSSKESVKTSVPSKEDETSSNTDEEK